MRVLTVARAKVDLLDDIKLNLKALDDDKGITEDTFDIRHKYQHNIKPKYKLNHIIARNEYKVALL